MYCNVTSDLIVINYLYVMPVKEKNLCHLILDKRATSEWSPPQLFCLSKILHSNSKKYKIDKFCFWIYEI